jgi:hypothetical protein
VGGLGHYLESEGLATTQISLIREHTETIRPPRALWVPFEMGRPLGAPNDSALQRRVLLAALRLLEAESGPVLSDCEEEAPGAADMEGWACPIDLGPTAEAGDVGEAEAAIAKEIALLRPWHDLAVAERGRTSVGTAGLELDVLAPFIVSFLDGPPPANPRPDMPLSETLRLACEDLKAFHMEAATAQPGRSTGPELENWFFDRTAAGRAYRKLKPALLASDDPGLREIGRAFVLPWTKS